MARPSKLDAFKPYIEERLKAGVWNAPVLLRELRARGFSGGYTILKDWLHPQRTSAQTVAVRRFETPPGQTSAGGPGEGGSKEELWASCSSPSVIPCFCRSRPHFERREGAFVARS